MPGLLTKKWKCKQMVWVTEKWELSMIKLSLWFIYSVYNNAREKRKKTTTTKINVCQLHNTSPVIEKPFYTSNGWGIKQTNLRIFFLFLLIGTQYGHNIEWSPSSCRKFSWSVSTSIRIILKTLNALLCVDVSISRVPNALGRCTWVSLGWCSRWVLSLPNGIGRALSGGNWRTATPQASSN